MAGMETIVVLYNAKKNELALWTETPYYETYWRGKPWVVWKSLTVAINIYGWEVVGEL